LATFQGFLGTRRHDSASFAVGDGATMPAAETGDVEITGGTTAGAGRAGGAGPRTRAGSPARPPPAPPPHRPARAPPPAPARPPGRWHHAGTGRLDRRALSARRWLCTGRHRRW